MVKENIENLRAVIQKEKKIVEEMRSLYESLDKLKNNSERKMVVAQLRDLKKIVAKENSKIQWILKEINLIKKFPQQKISTPKVPREQKKPLAKEVNLSDLEKITLKRLKKREKKSSKKREKKQSFYIKTANKTFSGVSKRMIRNGLMKSIGRDLTRANLEFLPTGYVSLMLFTTLVSGIIGLILFVFFLFFSIGSTWPLIKQATDELSTRLLKTFWMLFIIPLGTYLFMYVYPSLERKASEAKIDHELPFATINMSAISGSMIDPTKIFQIIVSTGEYPALNKEFTKLLNEINIHGYNLVSALRKTAFNNSSKNLSELLNGLATTITSGGSLPEFFEKRSQTLLFEHRLEREKSIKSSETFMDIYISVVIAAPMILMLLLMMMKVSGLGISLSTSAITWIMILGVSMINVVFLVFLHLKQS